MIFSSFSVSMLIFFATVSEFVLTYISVIRRLSNQIEKVSSKLFTILSTPIVTAIDNISALRLSDILLICLKVSLKNHVISGFLNLIELLMKDKINLRNNGSKRDELKIKIAISIKLKNNSFGLNNIITDKITNIKIIGIEEKFLL